MVQNPICCSPHYRYSQNVVFGNGQGSWKFRSPFEHGRPDVISALAEVCAGTPWNKESKSDVQNYGLEAIAGRGGLFLGLYHVGVYGGGGPF